MWTFNQIFIFTCILNVAIAFEGSMEFLPEIMGAQVSLWNKVSAFGIDYIHNIISGLTVLLPLLVMIQLFFFREINVYVVLALYALYMAMLGLFFKYRMCILTIIYNKLLGVNKCAPYIYPQSRLWDIRASAKYDEFGKNCELNAERWMQHHVKVTFVCFVFTIMIMGMKYFREMSLV